MLFAAQTFSAPLHGWVIHEAEKEYQAILAEDVNPKDGVHGNECNLNDDIEMRKELLKKLLEHLDGVAISAWEAWCITNDCLAAMKKDSDAPSADTYLKNFADSFSDYVQKSTVATKRKATDLDFSYGRDRTKLNFRVNREGNKSQEESFLAFLEFHGFTPPPSGLDIVKEDSVNLGVKLGQMEWKPTHPLLPDRQFLNMWNGIEAQVKGGQIASWMTMDPETCDKMCRGKSALSDEYISQRARNLGQESTFLDESLRSMKAYLRDSQTSRFPTCKFNIKSIQSNTSSTEV